MPPPSFARRIRHRDLWVILTVSVSLFAAFSTQPNASSGTVHPLLEAGGDDTQELLGALWRIGDGFQSTLKIQNVLRDEALLVNPEVLFPDGAAFGLGERLIRPRQTLLIDIGDAIGEHVSKSGEGGRTHGSVILRYSHPFPGALVGLIHNVDSANSLVFNFPFNERPASEPGIQTVEGVWWHDRPGGRVFFYAFNSSTSTRRVRMEFTDGNNQIIEDRDLTLAVGHDHLMRLDGSLSSGRDRVGGVRVRYEGRPDDLLLAAGVEHVRTGFSANRSP